MRFNDYYYGDEDYGDPEFQDPGGRSALRKATAANPRIFPCPTCGEEDKLTAEDALCGYQCNGCADHAERGGY